MHTDVYTGSLQTQSYIQSSQRKSTKQSHLDHLHHNQESDIDPLKTHTYLGKHTNTKNVDLDALKNTQHFSANTQKKLVQQNTRITLVTKANLKSIQAEIIFHTLSSITNSKQSQLFETLKNLYSKDCYSNLFF